MQMYHSCKTAFVSKSAPHQSARNQNDNCRRSFPFRDVLILYISQESQDDCLHADCQDTVKVSERLVAKQLYSAFQLLCITICITTKETNFKVQALHESSMSGCQGAKIWKFICVAVNELRERSYCFRYKSLLFVKPGLKQKLKKKTTLRQLAQIIISSSR